MSKHEIGCEVICDLLPLYADDLASPQARSLVEEHLKICDTCEKALERLQTQEERMPLSPNKALGQVKKQISKKRLRTGIIAGVAGLLAAIALVLIVHDLPLDVHVTQEDISSVEATVGYNPESGKAERQLLMKILRQIDFEKIKQDYHFNEDGSTTIVYVTSYANTIWNSFVLAAERFLDRGITPGHFHIFDAQVVQDGHDDSFSSPTGPIHWQIYTVDYYDWSKLDPRKIATSTGNIALLDENGELKPEMSKYCSMLWAGTTQDERAS